MVPGKIAKTPGLTRVPKLVSGPPLLESHPPVEYAVSVAL